MKIKTLLFGAGQGSRQYMQNNEVSRHFVGFLDNDKNKHGTSLEGIPIYSPSQIASLTFDEIVISTQWAIEVQQQLINELGVEPSKVIMPQKNQLKKITPFEHKDTMQLARKIVVTISTLALAQKVPIVVDFGTLLGLVRDGDLIEWDDDIDFAAPLDAADDVNHLLDQFVAEHCPQVNWRLERVADKQNNISGLLLKFSDPDQSLVEFTTSISFRQKQQGKSVHMPSLGMWFAPSLHFDSYQIMQWNNTEIPVPNDFADYLTFLYGDWQTPKKNIQLSDYANLQTVEFDDIQNASFTATDITAPVAQIKS